MPDMLNTAVSGLLSFQRALSTTSHNIANVNTEGYSRQRVEIQTQTPSTIGGLNYGNGSMVNAVTRSYDQFLTSEMRSTSSTHGKMNLLTELAGHVDNIIADPAGGISPSLNAFFDAVQGVSDDPTSTSARYNMINVAETMTASFHNMDTRFQQLEENTAKDIRTVVEEINGLTQSIAEINITLTNASASTQQSADLLDKRDSLLQELSERVDINVVNELSNDMSIFIGNGQTILNGFRAFTLEAVPNNSDPSLDYIVYNGLSQVINLSDSLKSGGELGALLEFRDSVLSETRNDLGRVAIALTETFNEQHQSGMDLNGGLGSSFFSVAAPKVLPTNGNVGNANISSSFSDVSALTRFDYDLTFDGTNWTLTSDSGTFSPTFVDSTPANTSIVFEGITLTIDGASNTSVAGDRYRIKPSLDGASSFDVLVSDPLLIAAAAPIRTGSSLNNLGTTAISAGTVTDASNASLLNTATLTFDTANSFVSTTAVTVGATSFSAGTSIPFTNGMTIDSNGWQAKISGIPQTNDVLTVQANSGGQGDNRNALALANLQNDRTMDGGNSNYQESYSSMVGRVGSQTASADTQRAAAESLLTQARDRKNSNSGVNLDEEAADLIRYQQAYEATSRIISTTQTLFDTLIAATR